MSDRVLIPLPDGRWLALEPQVFAAGLLAGAEIFAAPTGSGAAHDDEPLLTAEQLAEKLNVPVTRIETAARDGSIPAVELGRWRRFRRSAVERALAANGRGAA